MDTLDMANAYANHPFDDEELAAQKAEAEKNGEEYPEDMVTFTAQYKDVLNKEVFDFFQNTEITELNGRVFQSAVMVR